MLKKGKIKFSVQAKQTAKQVLTTAQAYDFLVVVDRGKQTPSSYKSFHESLLGVKASPDPQDQHKHMVYTNNISKTEKLLMEKLLNKLSLILYSSMKCMLYIPKAKAAKYKAIAIPGSDEEIMFLNEDDKQSVTKFEEKMKKGKSVNLADIILETTNDT